MEFLAAMCGAVVGLSIGYTLGHREGMKDQEFLTSLKAFLKRVVIKD